MSDFFTPEERRLAYRYLRSAPTAGEGQLWYVAFILPSVLFALYSLLNQDFVAALVAYVALLVVALMYLSQTKKNTPVFRSILEKYEAKVGALKD